MDFNLLKIYHTKARISPVERFLTDKPSQLVHPQGNRSPYFLNSKNPKEIEANMFAAELLLPFEWIKSDMRSGRVGIKQLARKYWVSEEAMGWRLFQSDALLLAGQQ